MRCPIRHSAPKPCRRLIPVLGDQLSPEIASLDAADRARDVILMAEVAEETTYVRHHKKKIAFIFSAMRHFAQELRSDGWTVDYIDFDAAENTGNLSAEIARAVARHRPERILVTEPGEWRLAETLRSCSSALGLPVDIREDDRFLCSHARFVAWAGSRKQFRMEHFYRDMRRKTGLLMAGDAPEGGRWNYDAENRKPAKDGLLFPQPLRFDPDATTRAVLDLVDRRFATHFGEAKPFRFGVTRKDAQTAFDAFLSDSLPYFGDYQDAMLRGQRFLFHAVISIYLNAGLLDPLRICRQAERAYRDGRAPLNAVEGFIRQIIGWREYVRGIYWLHMPSYADLNFFGHRRPLPDFYWTGDTHMACIAACVEQTRDEAYAHHIQRLMVTGNFAMLAGVAPKEIHEWYLAVYADAYEWVEMPNTLGMSQFADGGLLGSKPYAASGNYINRMSDYCGDCRYDVKRKTGETACPFNYLYWHFLARHRDRLGSNPRLAQVYRAWDRMDETRKRAALDDAERFLNALSPKPGRSA